MENNSSSSSLGGGGGCPVAKDATVVVGDESSSGSRHSWAAWFGGGGSGGGRSSSTNSVPTSSSASGCPVSTAVDQQQQRKQPASLEEAAAYPQNPHSDQKGVVLSTHRVISSIPRGATPEATTGPHHQPKTITTTTSTNSGHDDANAGSSTAPSHWIYPSEQQFFHALRRKGWDNVEASSIPSVLEIHNTINERTWKQVLDWERGMDLDATASGTTNSRNHRITMAEPTDLKLVRFHGRPEDISPQAFVWTKIFRWSDPPFDRHDWYVQKQPRRRRPPQQQQQHDYPVQRYVIDYYMIPPPHPDLPPTPYVDARPALDSPRALWLRATRLLQEELPGCTSEYYAWRSRQRRYYDGSGPCWTTTTTTSAST